MRKITLCLWLISGLFASFTSDAQDNSILLPQEKIRLSEAFDLIEGQSGYTVAYNEELLNINRQVLPPPNGVRTGGYVQSIAEGYRHEGLDLRQDHSYHTFGLSCGRGRITVQ